MENKIGFWTEESHKSLTNVGENRKHTAECKKQTAAGNIDNSIFNTNPHTETWYFSSSTGINKCIENSERSQKAEKAVTFL